MSQASKNLAISIASTFITALVIWFVSQSVGQRGMELLKSFAVTFIPFWVGLGVGLIVWASLSIWRVTHGRDDEFTKWLQKRKEEIRTTTDDQLKRARDNFLADFVTMADAARAVGERNAEAMKGFAEQYPYRLDGFEERIQKLEEIIKHGLHRG